MSYRDEQDALRAHAERLTSRVDELERELEAARRASPEALRERVEHLEDALLKAHADAKLAHRREPERRYVEVFKGRMRAHGVRATLLIVVVAAIGLGIVLHTGAGRSAGMVGPLVGAVASLLYTHFFGPRCPKCEERFPAFAARGESRKKCRSCGVRLVE